MTAAAICGSSTRVKRAQAHSTPAASSPGRPFPFSRAQAAVTDSKNSTVMGQAGLKEIKPRSTQILPPTRRPLKSPKRGRAQAAR